MVRILLIRHGENLDNVAMARTQLRMERGELGDPMEALRFMRAEMTDEGDGPLTPAGERQAQALGDYYAPMLAPFAASGRLHLFCSPILRTLQTIAPLARNLGAHKVTVKPDVAELPALATRKERQEWYGKIGERERAGDLATVRRWMREMDGKWTPCGLTGEEIVSRFNFAVLDADAFPSASHRQQPWCAWGCESEERGHERMQRVVAWFYHLRDTLPDDHVVAICSHGNTIGLVLRALLSEMDPERSFHGYDNTGVASVMLNKPPGRKDAPKLTGAKTFFRPRQWRRVTLEFSNRLDHLVALLGENRLQGFFTCAGHINAPTLHNLMINGGDEDQKGPGKEGAGERERQRRRAKL